jgi:hypothetical protein
MKYFKNEYEFENEMTDFRSSYEYNDKETEIEEAVDKEVENYYRSKYGDEFIDQYKIWAEKLDKQNIYYSIEDYALYCSETYKRKADIASIATGMIAPGLFSGLKLGGLVGDAFDKRLGKKIGNYRNEHHYPDYEHKLNIDSDRTANISSILGPITKVISFGIACAVLGLTTLNADAHLNGKYIDVCKEAQSEVLKTTSQQILSFDPSAKNFAVASVIVDTSNNTMKVLASYDSIDSSGINTNKLVNLVANVNATQLKDCDNKLGVYQSIVQGKYKGIGLIGSDLAVSSTYWSTMGDKLALVDKYISITKDAFSSLTKTWSNATSYSITPIANSHAFNDATLQKYLYANPTTVSDTAGFF